MKLTKELEALKFKLGILQKVACSESENENFSNLSNQGQPLPEGVMLDDSFDEYYRVQETSLSKDQLAEYLQYKQLHTLLVIKKCVIFFTVLTILSLAGGLVSMLLLLAS